MTAIELFFLTLTPGAWFALVVVGCIFFLLVATDLPADIVFIGGLGLLLLGGVLDPDTALAGFGSQGLVTVGALYVVVAGLQEAGGLQIISRWIPGNTSSPDLGRIRLMLPVGAMSAFLNNTPVVAMFIPVVINWCRRHKLSPSRFLIPLSYASILGGMCTLIGTSTNLVVNGLYLQKFGGSGLRMFEIGLLGLPCAVAGMGFMLWRGKHLLPDRQAADDLFGSAKSFTLELLVDAPCEWIGKPFAQSDLVDVPGGYLVELTRGEKVISPVPVAETVAEGDQLLYSGNLETIRTLLQLKGVKLAAESQFDMATMPRDRRLVEAVVSHTCPMVGKSMREGRFRQFYNAVVIAMARNGERLRGSLRDIPIKAGDVLLIESHAGFVPRQRDSGDFYLIHTLDEEVTPKAPAKATMAFAILVGMVLAAGFGWLSMLKASMLAAGLMLATGCCTPARARRHIEWHVLMVIGAALGIGLALDQSGAAGAVAHLLLGVAGGSPWMALVLVYIVTVLFTEVITNNAAVALVFPIAVSTAETMQVSPLPFIFCLMIGGSASFATPIGYQTNLMVYGAGGYQFRDYLRVGIPMSLVVGVVAVFLAPQIWPF